jgi:hypothetical protein
MTMPNELITAVYEVSSRRSEQLRGTAVMQLFSPAESL